MGGIAMGTITGLMEGETRAGRRDREPINASNASSLRRSCLEGRSSTFSLINPISPLRSIIAYLDYREDT